MAGETIDQAVLSEALLAEEGGNGDTKGDSDDGTAKSTLPPDDGGGGQRRPHRPTVQECLGVPENEMSPPVELDVYEMFYISDMWSQPFFYSIAILVTKMTLYVLLIVDLVTDSTSFPFDRKLPGEDVKPIVKLAQFFLIPVAIIIQEELMVSFYVLGNLQYSPGILKRHPGASRWKWHTATLTRFLDGAMFLFINTYIMLLNVNMLAIFLNFAALMFLQTIDNVALKACLDGHWTPTLQGCARDVVELKFAFRQEYACGCIRGRASVLWVSAAYALMVGFWAKTHFVDE